MTSPWSRLSRVFGRETKTGDGYINQSWKYVQNNLRHYKWFWSRNPLRIARDLIWWLRYRTTNKNHVVKTDLTPGWWDADSRLVHASFAILERFVEQEKPFDRIEWNEDDASREYSNEIHALYLWWKVHKNVDINSETLEQESKRYEEETENLVRLAKIRMCLWT